MPLTSFVTLVVSPRPRVGKTTIARLVADFHLYNGREIAAYDLNPPGDTLSLYLPMHTKFASIGEIKGQMALFDALIAPGAAHGVVDLGHEALERFFLIARDIDFVGEARKRGIATVIMFIVSPDSASVDGYAALARLFPGAVMIPVHNEVLGNAQYRERFPPHGKGSAMLHIQALAPGLRRITERKPFSFFENSGSAAPDVPIDIHIELQRWLRKIFLEMRELELRVLMADLQSSIGGAS